ncbi:MAG: sel1 repeat family protein [Paludibacteraceae bacterium]|nr:sel1 repeat family protein [Paludibacteraceae bacterium]
MCLVACNGKNSEEQKETSAEDSVEQQESFADDFSATLAKAEQGDATAQVNLGLMYEYGLGVAQDYYEAVKWYRLAAEQGNAYGQKKLGLMYEFGRGVAKDYTQAIRWYRQAADQGLKPAIEGYNYLKSKGY